MHASADQYAMDRTIAGGIVLACVLILTVVAVARLYVRSDFHRRGLERLDRHRAATAAAADTEPIPAQHTTLTVEQRRKIASELHQLLVMRYGFRPAQDLTDQTNTVRVWGDDGEYVAAVTTTFIVVGYRTNAGIADLGRHRGTQRAAGVIARHAGVREAA